MPQWNQKGIPHKGWECVGMEDLGESLDGLDYEEKLGCYEVCQMCGKEGIRYVHIMRHPDYPVLLRVGYRCAECMEADYINPKSRENILRNKHLRRKNFLKKEWRRKPNGNFVLKYKGHIVTIMPSNFANGGYGVYFHNSCTWRIHDKKIETFTEARIVAFSQLDKKINDQK